MDKRQLGELVCYLRKNRKITRRQLCQGVCGEATLCRLEKGERIPERMILERILSRMGTSVNKLDMIFTQQEYDLYCMQEQIENCIAEKQYRRAEELLELYEQRADHQRLYEQDILRLRAILARKQQRSMDEVMDYLEKAIHITIPEINVEEITDLCLAPDELTLILMWLEGRRLPETTAVEEISGRLMDYVMRFYNDEELLITIYPKSAFFLARFLWKNGKAKESAELCRQAIRLIEENGSLFCLPQIMAFYLEFLKNYMTIEERRVIRNQYESLRWLYGQMGKTIPRDEIEIWQTMGEREINLFSESIRRKRQWMRKSQERLGDEMDIDQKTISRIETGKHEPKEKTREKLKKQLKLDRNMYQPLLAVCDAKVLELRRDVGRYLFREEYDKAREVFEEIKINLDEISVNDPEKHQENQQYICYMQAILNHAKGNIDLDRLIKECIRAFRITKPDCNIHELGYVNLRMQEIVIANYVACALVKNQECEKALKIWEGMQQQFSSSKVNMSHHYLAESMILPNLASVYESLQQPEKALECCNQCIEISLLAKRGNVLGRIMTTKAYVLEQMHVPEDYYRTMYEKAFWLYALMADHVRKVQLETYYHARFGSDIRLVTINDQTSDV